MSTQQAVNEMITKYAEVYARALALGFDNVQSHEIAAKFFETGFKSLEKVGA